MEVEEMKARINLFSKAGKRICKLYDVEINDVRFLKFKTITEIKDALERADANTEHDILKSVFRDKEKEYKVIEGNEKQAIEFLFFIIDGIKAIANMENKSFESEISDVDTSGLDIFKEINIIDSLANGDILKWREIQELPYFDVFIKMLKNQEERKIERARIEKSKV